MKTFGAGGFVQLYYKLNPHTKEGYIEEIIIYNKWTPILYDPDSKLQYWPEKREPKQQKQAYFILWKEVACLIAPRSRIYPIS